jgi:hypothetical protein
MTPEDFPLVTIIEAHPDRRVSLDDLAPYMLDPPAPPVPRAPRGIPLDTPQAGDRPGDLFNASTTPEDVLIDNGWQLHHVDHRSGERHYTRPGKNVRDGQSATVYPDGHACVWTDATELEPKRWYDAFGLYAELNHRGSFVEATAAVRALGYGAPPRSATTEHRTAPADDAPVDGTHLDAFLVNWPDLWDVNLMVEDWLVQPVLARGRGHAIFAAAGVGKSWFTLELATAVATGRPIHPRPAREPMHVLYLDYEMTADDLRDRLDSFGYDADTDLSHLHYALLPTIPPLDTSDGGYIVVEAAKHYRVELVVVDTTARAVGGEENDANVYRAFYEHTGKPLKQAGIAWVRLDHAGKEVSKGQRGSSAKNDDVDVVWRLERREGNDLKLVATKRRMAWVPETADLPSRETEHGTTHVANAPTYPTGTFDVVKVLDRLGTPIGDGRRKVRAVLKEHGVSAGHDAVAAALKIRRQRANEASLAASNESNARSEMAPEVVPVPPENPSGQVDNPVPIGTTPANGSTKPDEWSRTTPVPPAGATGVGGVGHEVDHPRPRTTDHDDDQWPTWIGRDSDQIGFDDE